MATLNTKGNKTHCASHSQVGFYIHHSLFFVYILVSQYPIGQVIISNVLFLCRYRYRNDHFLNTLRGLLEVMYCGGEVQKDLLSLSTLHMMASSHSLFLPTMLDSHEEPCLCLAKGKSGGRVDEWNLIRCFIQLFLMRTNMFFVFAEALVSLLLYLVKKCPAVCNTNHFVVLLGAYGVTLSSTGKHYFVGFFLSVFICFSQLKTPIRPL